MYLCCLALACFVVAAAREVAVQQHEWSDQAFPTYLQSLTSYDPLSSSSSGSDACLSYDGCDGYQYLWKAIRSALLTEQQVMEYPTQLL